MYKVKGRLKEHPQSRIIADNFPSMKSAEEYAKKHLFEYSIIEQEKYYL